MEAARLESVELAVAIGRIRQSDPDDAACDAKMLALFAREAERVADASVLAEILLPLLRESLPSEVAHAGLIRPSRPVLSDAVTLRRPSAAAPGIADFIDQMIEQETATPAAAGP